MVELPFDLRKETRVRESQRVGLGARVELFAGREQGPRLGVCIAMYAPRSSGRYT